MLIPDLRLRRFSVLRRDTSRESVLRFMNATSDFFRMVFEDAAEVFSDGAGAPMM